MSDFEGDMLAESESYMIYTSEEEDEVLFHINLDNITLHLLKEEWDELLELLKTAEKNLRKK